MDINVVVLIGRLTKPVQVSVAGNHKVAKFTLAVGKGKDKGANFINCEAWDKTCEILEAYTNKGSRISVNGSIRTGSYDGANGKVYTTSVIANNVQLLDSRNDAQPSSSTTLDIEDDDLPF